MNARDRALLLLAVRRGLIGPEGASRAQALKEPARQHQLEAGGHHRDHAARDEQTESGVDGGLAPDAVGYRPIDDLSHGESQKQRGHHQLPVVLVGGAEVRADLRQGREHGVDGECDHRRHQRQQNDRFALAGLHG